MLGPAVNRQPAFCRRTRRAKQRREAQFSTPLTHPPGRAWHWDVPVQCCCWGPHGQQHQTGKCSPPNDDYTCKWQNVTPNAHHEAICKWVLESLKILIGNPGCLHGSAFGLAIRLVKMCLHDHILLKSPLVQIIHEGWGTPVPCCKDFPQRSS